MATFTNVATLSYNGTVVNSNVTTGEIQQTLAATKHSLATTYKQGDTLTYIVNIVNTGNTAFTNLTLTDNLGGYTYVTAGPPMTITGINVPANSEAQIVYNAIATAYAPLNIEGSITNSISITGDGITEPIAATETVNAATAPALDIEKSLSPTIVSENGQITYTFTVTNKGNTAVTQADDIVLRDVFNPILKNIGVTYNGTVLSNTRYTYNEATGVFETTAGAIEVPAATFATNTDGTVSVTPGTAVITVTGNI